MVPLLHRGKRPIPYSEELHSLDLPGFLQPPYKLQSSRVLDSVKVFDCKWSKNVAHEFHVVMCFSVHHRTPPGWRCGFGHNPVPRLPALLDARARRSSGSQERNQACSLVEYKTSTASVQEGRWSGRPNERERKRHTHRCNVFRDRATQNVVQDVGSCPDPEVQYRKGGRLALVSKAGFRPKWLRVALR